MPSGYHKSYFRPMLNVSLNLELKCTTGPIGVKNWTVPYSRDTVLFTALMTQFEKDLIVCLITSCYILTIWMTEISQITHVLLIYQPDIDKIP
jgi:hypothetical protein